MNKLTARSYTALSYIIITFIITGAVIWAALLPSPVSAGSLYSFVDERGVMHFTNVPTDPRYLEVSHGKVSTEPSSALRQVPRPTIPRSTNRSSRASEPSHQELSSLISEAARRHSVDPALIKAIIEVESGGKSSARSPKGAVGLMQLMPETAAEMGVRDRRDSWENIRGGTGYFKTLLEKFNGDIVLALAAYNAGPASVEKYNGIPPYLETVRYVRKVLEAWNRHRHNIQK